ncbi:MAG TPA: alkaline phosphatase D family protein [Blastocatellia bacterium]|nr:alkaline phosphatase D family protein [Blastocatellia bacterium]
MADEIIFGPWVGGVTSAKATIKAGLANGLTAQLVLSQNSDLSSPSQFSPTALSVSSEMTVMAFALTGLQPGQQFHYALRINGSIATERQGRFRTFPVEGNPASFTFACAGDAKGGELFFSSFSNHRVFDLIRLADPLFFIHLGDLHYDNIGSTKIAAHVDGYRGVLKEERQARLYRNVPLAYTWDDHDFCGDASDGKSKGRKAARLAYQRAVPHYPLVEGEGDVAIYQPFTVGRVRFLLTDTRSERTPRKDPDSAAKSILGARQKQWLKDRLLEGRDQFPLQVWVNSVPWIGDPQVEDNDTDAWFSYPTERNEMGSFIENNGITNVLMLCADAHMIAIDDGSNNRGTTGKGGFPVLCAAPLDRPNSKKGKPFSHGIFDDHKGQYGLITVNDTGEQTVQVTIRGKHEENTLVTFSFNSPL